MKIILLLAGLLAFGFEGVAQHTNQYCNSVYSFCLQVPGTFTRRGESKQGFGQYFTAKDGSQLTIFGTYNLQDETLKQRFDREVASLASDSAMANSTQLPNIEKAELQDNSFTIIFQNQGFTDFIYRRFDNNSWRSIELHYPTSKAQEYADKAQKMIGSLR